MPKKVLLLTLIVLLASTPALIAEEQVQLETETSSADFFDRLELGLASWFSSGESGFEIAFRFPDGSFFPGFSIGSSELEWEDLDSVAPIISGMFEINDRFSIGGHYSSGDIDDGSNSDTDLINGRAFSESSADTDGEYTAYDISLYVNLDEILKIAKLQVDGFIGYQYYKDELRDQNGVQEFSSPADVFPLGPFPGLNSTFQLEWTALRLGVQGDYELMEKLHILASLALLVGVDYEGEGFWNLRSDFRQTSPNFEQEADDGEGIDFRIAANYELFEHLLVELGFWVIALESNDGTDTIFGADGSELKTTLIEANSTRYGAYVGATVPF